MGVLRAIAGPLSGQEFPISSGQVVLGRDSVSDVVLADPMVSKRHARIETGQYIEVVDLNSANGVLVDGVAVQQVRLEEESRSSSARPRWSCALPDRTTVRRQRSRSSSAVVG